MKSAISNGADINWSGLRNFTPLHIAVYRNRSDAVQWLLSNGATVDSRDKAGWTPLIWAAINGDTQLVTMLLEKGADVTASTDFGDTALDCAKRNGHSDTATLLRVYPESVKYMYCETIPGLHREGEFNYRNDLGGFAPRSLKSDRS
uniref:Uncharacterized protein n=1 Tax=Amphimedon queenslandica TaxID=400682 RepID=A0A1X7T4A9_AMPQE